VYGIWRIGKIGSNTTKGKKKKSKNTTEYTTYDVLTKANPQDKIYKVIMLIWKMVYFVWMLRLFFHSMQERLRMSVPRGRLNS
jgi:hypothetical protein